jgi:hypothetical protein
VLIFRCANGVVAWLISRSGQEMNTATCTADGTVVQLARSPDQTWVNAIASIGAHSVSLKGSIVETIFIPEGL